MSEVAVERELIERLIAWLEGVWGAEVDDGINQLSAQLRAALAAPVAQPADELLQQMSWKVEDGQPAQGEAVAVPFLTCPRCNGYGIVHVHDAASPVAPGWQPIETAPKDGTEILAWREDCGPFMAQWNCPDELRGMTDKDRGEWEEGELFEKDWFGGDSEGSYRCDDSEAPTHWMPLPAAPERKES